MRNWILFACTLGFVWFHATAQSTTQVVSSSVTFAIKNSGITVNGSFSGLVASIHFDPQSLPTASIKASVKSQTIKTGIDARDRHLKKENYLNSVQFPEITIVSSFFGKTTTGYKAYCKLTMKGITKDIVIPFNFTETKNGATMEGSFSLNRLDYQVGEQSLILSDDVIVYIKLILENNG
jgi:polyisoprenoid-binding protein YceI